MLEKNTLGEKETLYVMFWVLTVMVIAEENLNIIIIINVIPVSCLFSMLSGLSQLPSEAVMTNTYSCPQCRPFNWHPGVLTSHVTVWPSLPEALPL